MELLTQVCIHQYASQTRVIRVWDYILLQYHVVGDDFRGENSVVTGWGRTQSSIVTDLVDPADILQVEN